jgi:hypothetical protein
MDARHDRTSSDAVVHSDAVVFEDPADDTVDNRAIVKLVEERGGDSRPEDVDLDDLVVRLGYDPVDFVAR